MRKAADINSVGETYTLITSKIFTLDHKSDGYTLGDFNDSLLENSALVLS